MTVQAAAYSPSAYLYGLYGSRSVSNTQYAELVPQAKENGADKVTVSPEAQQLNSITNNEGGLIKELFPGVDGPVKLENIRSAVAEEFSAFKSAFGNYLRERGIDRTPSFTLTSDGEGKVRVRGEHPQKEEIEAIFTEHPELRDQFAKVSAMSSLVRAADEGLKFRKAYAQDPQEAVNRYAYLFNDNRSVHFNMTISEDDMEVSFG
jgi:hypothetical protein